MRAELALPSIWRTNVLFFLAQLNSTTTDMIRRAYRLVWLPVHAAGVIKISPLAYFGFAPEIMLFFQVVTPGKSYRKRNYANPYEDQGKNGHP